MQLSRSVISDDVIALREESKEYIREHLEHNLPLAFKTCKATFESSKRRAYEILEKAEDPRVKLQAIQIINDSTMKIMDLETHNEAVKAAMSYAEKTNKKLDPLNEVIVVQQQKDKTNNDVENAATKKNNNHDTERLTENNAGAAGTTGIGAVGKGGLMSSDDLHDDRQTVPNTSGRAFKSLGDPRKASAFARQKKNELGGIEVDEETKDMIDSHWDYHLISYAEHSEKSDNVLTPEELKHYKEDNNRR